MGGAYIIAAFSTQLARLRTNHVAGIATCLRAAVTRLRSIQVNKDYQQCHGTTLHRACRFSYAPYQLLKSYGIKGPTPIPFFGNYREEAKMVRS